MYLLHVINSDRQTQLLKVIGQIAMYWAEGGLSSSRQSDCRDAQISQKKKPYKS